MSSAPPRVVVVGAGPAGIAAALSCHELGFACTVVDPGEPGGILRLSGWPMSWSLGLPGATGAEVAQTLADHLRQAEIPLRRAPAQSIDPASQHLHLQDTDPLPYDALIVATGVRFRHAGIPGEEEAPWVHHRPPLSPAATSDPSGPVVILGGGDNAFSTAVAEAEAAPARQVLIALRGDRPKAHARTLLAAARLKNIAVRTNFRAIQITSTPQREIHFETPQGPQIVPCGTAYVHFGYAPNSEWTAGTVQLTKEKHIVVDAEFRTTAPHIWAVGEVTGPAAPCVQTVLAHGPVAALSIAKALRDENAIDAAISQLKARGIPSR